MEYSELNKYIANPALLNKSTLEGLRNLAEAYPYFQTAWILYLKNLKIINHPKFKPELERVAIRISDRRKLYHYLYPERGNSAFILNALSKASATDISGYSSWQKKGLGEKSKNSLIDTFIESQPTIKLNQDEEKPAPSIDISEKSVEVNDEIITETLAQIFVSQKKYGQAIKAFEKLCLKFPEKNSYFAAQIDEINKIKNK